MTECAIVLINTKDHTAPYIFYKDTRNCWLLTLNDGQIPKHRLWHYQHMYFVSKNPAEVGEWYHHKNFNKIKWNDGTTYDDVSRKVEASTDPRIKVPSISKFFVKMFLQHGKIEKVIYDIHSNKISS